MATCDIGTTVRIPEPPSNLQTFTCWVDDLASSTSTTTTTALTWTEWTATSITRTTSSSDTWHAWHTGNITPTGSTTTRTYYTTDEVWVQWTTVDGQSQVRRVGEPPQRVIATGYRDNHGVHTFERKHDAHVMAYNEEQRRIAQKKRNEERAAARKRAEELLITHLTDAQRSDLKRDGFFFVESQLGKRYRIRKGREGNVDRYCDKGEKIVGKLCIHPQAYVPDFDTMLAQKLMLEHNEQEFLRVANETRVLN